jgi:DNA-binding response OmpR family regulator
MLSTTIKEPAVKKLLIIEDEGDMCLLLNILLKGEDMDLDHVQNLSDAADYLEKQQPAVVILDNKLPDGFGVDFISYLKQRYPAIKIIMISGYDGAAKDVAMENGADIYLAKPFTRNQLFDAVTGLLDK